MFNNEIWDKCKKRSMMGEKRIEQIHSFLTSSISHSPDSYAIAEIGVLKGGTSKYISMIASFRKVYLFDTFNGLPQDFIHPIDGHYTSADFSDTNIDEIVRYLSDCNNIIIKNGVFPETASDINEKFCFVLIDCVLYYSVHNSLVYFYDKIDINSNIIIDDYGRPECPGVKVAVDSFLNEKKDFKFEILEDFMINIRRS